MNDLTSKQMKPFVRFCLYFITLAIILSIVAALLCRFGFEIVAKEDGLMEWLECLWLCISCLFLFLASTRKTDYSKLFGILWLVPLIAVFRELDGIFDKAFFHGAWVVPAGIIVILVVYKILKSSATLAAEVLGFMQSQQIIFLGFGFFMVVVFAQVCGWQAVWHKLLGEHYHRRVGRFIEELIEFFGYVTIIMGSLECWLGAEERKTSKEQPKVTDKKSKKDLTADYVNITN